VQGQIRADFQAAFRRRDRDEWVAELSGADTCVAPVYAISELVQDEHFAQRGAFVEARFGDRGSFRQVGAVLAGSGPIAAPVEVRDPSLSDADEVLGAAGLSAEEIEKLRGAGIVA
jgi:crotonobetainyl-CoA:carnitine CoA-transferase CaiB-like acyl-CoA transferase